MFESVKSSVVSAKDKVVSAFVWVKQKVQSAWAKAVKLYEYLKG